MLNIGNHNRKPPVPSKENNPLQGLSISKIDFYGLGEIVRKLRNANISYVDIANTLNEKYLTGDCPKISTMGVQRWCKKNITEDIDLRENEDTAVNVYRQKCDDLQTIEEQIDNIKIYIDQFNKEIKRGTDVTNVAGKVKDMLFLMEKLLARKQSLLNDIAIMQEKVYSYMAANDIVRETLDIVKEADLTIYANVMEKLKTNPMIIEAYKRIRPD